MSNEAFVLARRGLPLAAAVPAVSRSAWLPAAVRSRVLAVAAPLPMPVVEPIEEAEGLDDDESRDDGEPRAVAHGARSTDRAAAPATLPSAPTAAAPAPGVAPPPAVAGAGGAPARAGRPAERNVSSVGAEPRSVHTDAAPPPLARSLPREGTLRARQESPSVTVALPAAVAEPAPAAPPRGDERSPLAAVVPAAVVPAPPARRGVAAAALEPPARSAASAIVGTAPSAAPAAEAAAAASSAPTDAALARVAAAEAFPVRSARTDAPPRPMGLPADRAATRPLVAAPELAALLAPPAPARNVRIDRVDVSVRGVPPAPPPARAAAAAPAAAPTARAAAHGFRNPWAAYHAHRD